jgi:hypothetical protein
MDVAENQLMEVETKMKTTVMPHIMKCLEKATDGLTKDILY